MWQLIGLGGGEAQVGPDGFCPLLRCQGPGLTCIFLHCRLPRIAFLPGVSVVVGIVFLALPAQQIRHHGEHGDIVLPGQLVGILELVVQKLGHNDDAPFSPSASRLV